MPGRQRPAGTSATVAMGVARPTHAKIRDLADCLSRQKGRTVTFSEMLEILVRNWEETDALVREVRAAGR